MKRRSQKRPSLSFRQSLRVFGIIVATGAIFAAAAGNFYVAQTAITLFGVVAAFCNVAFNTVIVFHKNLLFFIIMTEKAEIIPTAIDKNPAFKVK